MIGSGTGVRSFLEWFETLIWVLGFAIAVLLLEKRGWLQGPDTLSLDAALEANFKPQVNDEIAVIRIKDPEYKSVFQATSPLDPGKILWIIGQIQEANPWVIGIDLDTASDQWNPISLQSCKYGPEKKADGECQRQLNRYLQPSGDAPVIWAQVPRLMDSREANQPLAVDCVVGGQLDNEKWMGIPLFYRQLGVVREYQRQFDVVGHLKPCADIDRAAGDSLNDQEAKMRSLSEAVLDCYRHSCNQAAPGLLEQLKGLVYYDKLILKDYQFKDIDSKAFFCPEESNQRSSDNASGKENKSDDGVRSPRDVTEAECTVPELKGKIVLVGGDFEAARDRYQTPFGSKAGVELVAQAIATDLEGTNSFWGGPIHAVRGWAVFALDLLMGFLVACFFRFCEGEPRKAFRGSLGLAAFGFVASRWVVHVGVWISFIPVMVGMILHEMYEADKKLAAKLHQERESNETLRLEVKIREEKQQNDLSRAFDVILTQSYEITTQKNRSERIP
jgi:CHASE2 domain-containing sensor protein